MKYVIDRFEGMFAVCEDKNRNMVNIERTKLPLDAKEGDVLKIIGDKITIDTKETKRRRNRIDRLMNDLYM